MSAGSSPDTARNEQPLPIIRGVKQSGGPLSPQTSTLKEQAQSALDSLNSKGIPLSTDTERLSKYTTIISKECLPGRDDSNGEINQNTNRNRECLRFVPKNSNPRIGIMISPGFISNGLGNWIKTALLEASRRSGNEIDIILAGHVPVYGYGKSHGFSKLIRITLPQPLALMDASVYEKLRTTTEDGVIEDLNQSKLAKITAPTKSEIESVVKLIMRWHCRLSHVSAHTSMISVNLNDALKDPTTILHHILKFVFADDWEWEGGNKDKVWKEIDAGEEAAAFIDSESTRTAESCLLKRAIDDTKIVQKYMEQALDESLLHLVQNAFIEEMDLSEDLTHWPCPSFWKGVDKLQLNTGLVPDCREDHPWIKCTINRDKCEMKQDPECK